MSGLIKDIKVSFNPWPSDKEFPNSSDIPFVFMRSEDNLPVYGVALAGVTNSANSGSC